MDLEDLAGAQGGQIPANFNAEEAPNAEEIEQQFSVVCIEQAEAYWNLITKHKPSSLSRLTKYDDLILDSFQKAFPELQTDERLKNINEEEMKSPDGKKRWRAFMTPFDKVVADYNFGTLIRANCEDEDGYTEQNSIFGYRVQFFAIEIARNRRGLNDVVWEKLRKSS